MSNLCSVRMLDKLCLQWNDFKENVNSAFGRLRDDTEFTDVTLACEDGQQMEAHKVILAASSPFFEKILQRNKHPHPLIYLRGFQSKDLHAILDFLYLGKANVFQENLDSFLAIAEQLKLKGLSGQTSSDVVIEQENTANPKRYLENHQLIIILTTTNLFHMFIRLKSSQQHWLFPLKSVVTWKHCMRKSSQ